VGDAEGGGAEGVKVGVWEGVGAPEEEGDAPGEGLSEGEGAGHTTRRREGPSPTKSSPLLALNATLFGFLKEAPVPAPSTAAAAPLPAMVLTTPRGVTLRMR
jgi:hypothetical protein